MDKKLLRRKVLEQRLELEPSQVEAKSQQICNRLMAMPLFEQAQTVMFYLDFRQEPATGQAIQTALKMGKRVLVPVTRLAEKQLIPAQLLDFPGDLQTSTFGIREPKPALLRPVSPAEIDLVVMPGVAINLAGHRLGYGAGLYDRFLPTINPKAALVALAYEMQIRAEVEPEVHDYPVQWIVTENRLINCLSNTN